MVDAAVALQELGHDVTIFTSRHDVKRCFDETRDGELITFRRLWPMLTGGLGTLQVRVLGSSIPMTLHPRFSATIVCSIVRSLLLAILLLFSLLLPGPASPFNPLSPLPRFDVFIVDQQSVAVPLLKFVSGSRVVFYCHFPDKLLSAGWTFNDKEVKRQGAGLLRRAYRWPVDKLEEFTTGGARQ